MVYDVVQIVGIVKVCYFRLKMYVTVLFSFFLNLNLNLNSLLVKRQIDNPSPGAVTGGN